MQLERGLAVAAEAKSLGAKDHRAEVLEHRFEGVVAEGCYRNPVQLFVGVERSRDITCGNGSREAIVGIPHAVEVGITESTGHLAHGQRVHRRDHVAGILNGSRVNRRHRCRPAGDRRDESARSEPQKCLAHGRATHAQPLGEIAILQLFTGQECAVDDRVTESAVNIVAQKRAVDAGAVRGNGHAICCTHSPRGRKLQGLEYFLVCNMLHITKRQKPFFISHPRGGVRQNERDTMNTTIDQGIKNVVLVHGAFADGSGWRNVYDNLTGQGYTVSIVQNPLTSLEADVAATRRVLDLQDGPTILVGHSWGGTVITEAGLHDKVAGLVYVAALAPDSGETTAQQYEGFAATPDFVIDVGDDGYGFLNHDKFAAGFAADASEADAAFLRDSQVPINMAVFGTAVTTAAWRDKPTWAVIGTEDKAFDQAMLQHMATRSGAAITTVPASHAVYLTQAGVVSDVIVTAAENALVSAR